MAKRRFSAAVLSAVLVCAGTALAAPGEESGWYGGLDASRSRLGFGYRFGPARSLEGRYGRHERERRDGPPAAPWALRPDGRPAYGLGARYDFTRRWFGRFEWDRYGPGSELDPLGQPGDRYSIRFGVRF
jgi:hypothetical protein